MYYAITTIEGLHLMCDFVIHSAALYGCPPDYTPTPVGLHDVYRQPYENLGRVPFDGYSQLASVSFMDQVTLVSLASLTNLPKQRLSQFTCVAYEISLGAPNQVFPLDAQANTDLLERVIYRGERILDVMRLFLYKPGQIHSLGRVGSLGNGVSGAWLGDDGEHMKFIARESSRFQLVQTPVTVGLDDVRKIYTDPVYVELKSAVTSDDEPDVLLGRIFESLRAFRESRDIQSQEARFRHLAAIAEDLAKRDENESPRLSGDTLRDRIAQIAQQGWWPKDEVLAWTNDLWNNVRNPLAHSTKTFNTLGRSATQDNSKLEEIVISMIQAVTLAWRDEQFGTKAYDSLLEDSGLSVTSRSMRRRPRRAQ